MELTHLDEKGAARMVNVSQKQATERIAKAESRVRMAPETLKLILAGEAKKGDVLAVARVAGIMAAKKTSELIPLCHQIPITGVSIEFEAVGETELVITSFVKTVSQTGVEMEALVAASVSALTVYDMLKAVDRGMVIAETLLVLKDGGRSGRFERGTRRL
ncbi:MAG TPA: cyclic pyranopterin monophosphate synthase MoaC [Anaerolineaceae bacterium]|nr:cyclic pyranopterin monophosphate synthase MoaC [Anaerolineaceae bacterium]